MADYELFWERIKKNDKVLVKAPIQNKVNKECYFLGAVRDKSIHTEDQKHVVVIQLEGETDRRAIKLENIGPIENVKKTIIPMDFIFKDENIKAGKIEKAEFECKEYDPNCDGEEFGDDEVVDLDDLPDKKEDEPSKKENVALEVKGNETPKQDIVDEGDLEVQNFSDDEEEGYRSEDFTDFSDGKEGGKKKKKKNRSRSKKNKKKKKRKNSTKKKN